MAKDDHMPKLPLNLGNTNSKKPQTRNKEGPLRKHKGQKSLSRKFSSINQTPGNRKGLKQEIAAANKLTGQKNVSSTKKQ